AGSECCITQLVRETLPQCFSGPGVIRQTQIASDNMFQEPSRWILCEGQHHFTQNHGNMGKSVICLANITQATVI
ncbi:hypothetical protein O3G_MSEX001084, partial [Manduca sexta]